MERTSVWSPELGIRSYDDHGHVVVAIGNLEGVIVDDQPLPRGSYGLYIAQADVRADRRDSSR